MSMVPRGTIRFELCLMDSHCDVIEVLKYYAVSLVLLQPTINDIVLNGTDKTEASRIKGYYVGNQEY